MLDVAFCARTEMEQILKLNFFIILWNLINFAYVVQSL